MAGGTHTQEQSSINWAEKYIERLSQDMEQIRGMEGRLTGQIDDLNGRMNTMIDSFNNKLDDNTKHINNLVITMAIGVGVAVISAVIAIASLIRS